VKVGRLPKSVKVDLVIWLLLALLFFALGSPGDSNALRFFAEAFGLAAFREICQYTFVQRRKRGLVNTLTGLIYTFMIFVFLGTGVFFTGIWFAWGVVALYLFLMVALQEPVRPDSVPMNDPLWDEALSASGLQDKAPELLHSPSAAMLIFTVGGRQPRVTVGAPFNDTDTATRRFLYAHELGHLSLGHFRRLSLINAVLYALVLVSSISAIALHDARYLSSGLWPPVGHFVTSAVVMTLVGWLIQRLESATRTRLEAEADLYAVEHTGDAETAIAFLRQHAGKNDVRMHTHQGRQVSATRRLQLLSQNLELSQTP